MTIKPSPPFRKDGKIHLQAELISDSGESRTLWYRVPESLESAVTSHADPFVVGALFLAMRLGEPVHVEGTVSPSLLRNLDRYMAAWSQWHPDKYRRVEVTAREEKEAQKPATDGVVMAFSGGIDSSYTAWTQANRRAGRQQVELAAAVFVLGFDIPLEYEETDYASYFERARVMTDSIGIDLIPVSTNFRELDDWWEHAYGTAIASVFHIFKNRFGGGMIASDFQQYNLDYRHVDYGSNVFIDPWLGGSDFKIHHDGSDRNRLQKIEAVVQWSEAMKHIRVCWQGDKYDRNCCRCSKCIVTSMRFRILGMQVPDCFPSPLTDDELRSIDFFNEAERVSIRRLVKDARDRGITDSWVDALEESLKPAAVAHTPVEPTKPLQDGVSHKLTRWLL